MSVLLVWDQFGEDELEFYLIPTNFRFIDTVLKAHDVFIIDGQHPDAEDKAVRIGLMISDDATDTPEAFGIEDMEQSDVGCLRQYKIEAGKTLTPVDMSRMGTVNKIVVSGLIP